jgi:hypothetical protein
MYAVPIHWDEILFLSFPLAREFRILEKQVCLVMES